MRTDLLRRSLLLLIAILAVWSVTILSGANSNRVEAEEFKLTGDWTIQVIGNGVDLTVQIDPPDYVKVVDEEYASVAPFRPNGPLWYRAERLRGLIAYECTIDNAVVAGSVKLRTTKGTGEFLKPNVDYFLDEVNANFGLKPDAKLAAGTKAYLSYEYVKMRIDSIVRGSDGKIFVVRGEPHASMPAPAELAAGQTRLATVWINGQIKKLTDANLFPIEKGEESLSHAKQSPAGVEPIAKSLVPKSWKKLVSGEKIRILAWGDSVTDAGYLPKSERWQFQFVEQLRKVFPQADIVLMTEAWGGRNSDSYRNEPAGSPKNYKEKVLALKPDLIVSEFVNDSGMNIATVQKKYGEMLADFRGIGAEWIILTPHYVRPSWMGLTSLKNTDNDPRPYTTGLRLFTKDNNIALADASKCYGRLWRKGVPYIVLMTNNINHPNKYGMSIFADTLTNLFR